MHGNGHEQDGDGGNDKRRYARRHEKASIPHAARPRRGQIAVDSPVGLSIQ